MLTVYFFFFNDTATTEIYTLSLHDALPIFWSKAFGDSEPKESQATELCQRMVREKVAGAFFAPLELTPVKDAVNQVIVQRSEEHTSELQSQSNLVCRLLLEKKKKTLMACLL